MVAIGGAPDNGVTAIRNEILFPQSERFVYSVVFRVCSPCAVNLRVRQKKDLYIALSLECAVHVQLTCMSNKRKICT
jgi:hypothetical protein